MEKSERAVTMLMSAQDEKVALLLGPRRILLIDDEPYTRKVIKTLLLAMGVKHIQEAADKLGSAVVNKRLLKGLAYRRRRGDRAGQ